MKRHGYKGHLTASIFFLILEKSLEKNNSKLFSLFCQYVFIFCDFLWTTSFSEWYSQVLRDVHKHLWGRALMQKNFIAKKIQVHLQTSKKKKKKKKITGPLLAWKLWISPIEKYVNSVFTRKLVAKKFRAPFLPWKLWVIPIKKHVISIFTRKFVPIFSRPPYKG